MSEALCDSELHLEMADVLPDREALSIQIGAPQITVVTQVGVSTAVTALSKYSFTSASSFNFASL